MRDYYYGTASYEPSGGIRIPDLVRQWRQHAQCKRCHLPISEHLEMEIRGISCFHPSCAAIYDRQQKNVRSSASTTPSVIGRIVGVAVPFNQQCFVFPQSGGDRAERFDQRAFSDSIRRGGQQLTIDHCGAVAGRMELFEEPDRLSFRFHVHDTPLGRTTLERIKRRECRGCSIGFRAAPDGERALPRPSNTVIVTYAELTEVSLCFNAAPAWYGTAAQLEQ